ncbi:MAG: long-chain-fatty-acid--CoA ligase [Proteobacteria bacterium]|nr:long-chain-fatty-acid--CoA ligase [Pseudomonadota bacterium]
MLGLMQDWQLTLDKVLDHAARVHGGSEVITRRTDGKVYRTTYAAIHRRARQVSNALLRHGIRLGDRVGTLGWNSERHLETWYGAMGIGAVLHTLNPRLHPDQLAWIINHAENRVVVFDTTFLPLAEAVADKVKVEKWVVIADPDQMPANAIGAVCYEEWIAGESAEVAWGQFDERTAAGLCYTSGTTGDPKGVLYSHRSNMLEMLMAMGTDCIGISAHDVVLPVVPMFHANAWGLAFAGPASGASLVMPGAQLDGPSVYELLDSEKVTISAAVPTVWLGLLQHMEANGLKLPHLKKVVIGGSAVPERVLRAFEVDYGVEVYHAWGMTEMSPMGTIGRVPAGLKDAPLDVQLAQKLKQGLPPCGVELKIVDEHGTELPRDGESSGRLLVKGMAVVGSYFRHDDGTGRAALDADGWFDTGDVASIDQYGTMKITDRTKDVIKSGGEWISSIDLENAALLHPAVANAAAIGIPHPKWDERPLLVIEKKPGASVSEAEIKAFLDGKIAKWWMPDAVVFIDAIPLGATGKNNKLKLREMYAAGELTVAA